MLVLHQFDVTSRCYYCHIRSICLENNSNLYRWFMFTWKMFVISCSFHILLIELQRFSTFGYNWSFVVCMQWSKFCCCILQSVSNTHTNAFHVDAHTHTQNTTNYASNCKCMLWQTINIKYRFDEHSRVAFFHFYFSSFVIHGTRFTVWPFFLAMENMEFSMRSI